LFRQRGVALVEVARAAERRLDVGDEPRLGRVDHAQAGQILGAHLLAVAVQLRRHAAEVLDVVQELRVVIAPRRADEDVVRQAAPHLELDALELFRSDVLQPGLAVDDRRDDEVVQFHVERGELDLDLPIASAVRTPTSTLSEVSGSRISGSASSPKSIAAGL
jgi:hypothetical protein